EGSFFLSVVMVLYTSWSLGSVTRAVVIAVFAAAAPWFVVTYGAPDSGIGWNAWATAHGFTYVLGRTLHRQRMLIAQLEAARHARPTRAAPGPRRGGARAARRGGGRSIEPRPDPRDRGRAAGRRTGDRPGARRVCRPAGTRRGVPQRGARGGGGAGQRRHRNR